MATAAKKEKVAGTAPKPVKQLTVDLTSLEKVPEFTFEGDWSGKDVRVVLRHISQAYRRNQIARAKAMAPRQEPPIEQGASNDGTN